MTVSVVTHNPYDGVLRADWTALAAGETGDAASMGRYRALMSVQVTGTFNTETVTLEGSLDGATWFALTDDGATPIAITADGYSHIYERAAFIRPVVSAGAGVDIDVRVEGLCLVN